jgi:hypothetical protein
MQPGQTLRIAMMRVLTHIRESRCCADSSVPTYTQRPLSVGFDDERGDEDHHSSASNFLEACTIHVARQPALPQAYLAIQHELAAANEIPHQKDLIKLGSQVTDRHCRCYIQFYYICAKSSRKSRCKPLIVC